VEGSLSSQHSSVSGSYVSSPQGASDKLLDVDPLLDEDTDRDVTVYTVELDPYAPKEGVSVNLGDRLSESLKNRK